MSRFEEILNEFSGKKIVVVGDLMLDRYFEGTVDRINPEAPVPIVSLKKEFNELGGAGNVAANIAALNGYVSLFAFVGDDQGADKLKAMLKQENITQNLDRCPITITKTRVLGSGQQLIRYDQEETAEKKFSEKIQEKLLKQAAEADRIIISDYAKGTITKDLMNALDPFRKKILVDPKPKNKNLYRGVSLITPNEKEGREMASCADADLAGNTLKQELNANILLTRGEKGMAIFTEASVNIPTYARDVFDVTGAGDTVIATVAMALAAGATLKEAAILANTAAGLAIEKKGTYHVPQAELKKKIIHGEKKILDFETLKKQWKT